MDATARKAFSFLEMLNATIAESIADGLPSDLIAGLLSASAGRIWRETIPDEHLRRAVIAHAVEWQVNGPVLPT